MVLKNKTELNWYLDYFFSCLTEFSKFDEDSKIFEPKKFT